ncbi:MAG: prenyltransferase/squalene oxidase repeat-containing protein [Pirellulaceae bacterium]
MAQASDGVPAPARCDDGGFAKTEEGAASSTYQTFLVCVAFDMLHQPIPESDRIVEFLRSQQMDDGGFREIARLAVAARIRRRPRSAPCAS